MHPSKPPLRTRKKKAKEECMKFLSLCSGYGGMNLGIERTGEINNARLSVFGEQFFRVVQDEEYL